MNRRIVYLVVILAISVVATSWLLRRGTSLQYAGSNVLLVTLDTLRADRLGAYGYSLAETPRLDHMAAEGIVFEDAISPVPLTLPSHTTIMTSLRPPVHGVRDNGSFDIAAEAEPVAERFRAAGYDTGAFVGAYVLHSRWGLASGFDEYDDDFDYGSGDQAPGQVERRGDAVVAAALPWINAERDRPFFAWVHLYDPHAPYTAPEPWASRHEDSYDGEVAFTDDLVGRILDGLADRGELENTIVVVVGDHGEGLGDHDEPGHGLFLYDTTQRVPFIVRLPGADRSRTRVEHQVRMLDVAPTLLDFAGLAVPTGYEGTTVRSLLDDSEPASRPAYSETYFPRFHFGWKELFALRLDGFKLVLAPRPELYDLGEDPGEERNLYEDLPARARRMQEQLESLLGDAAADAPRIDPEAAEQLRALGYLGRAPETSDGEPLADPKDKVGLLTMLTRAQGLVSIGQHAGAVDLLEEILGEDPRVVDAQLTLGNALLALQDLEGAAAAFEATLLLSPDYDLALSNLALVRRRMGDRDRAKDDFDVLLSMVPDSTSAHFNLGEMALEDDDAEGALSHFRAGIGANPSLPGMHRGLGIAAVQLGLYAEAETALRQALELAPGIPDVHYYLAQIAAARQDTAAEEAEYRAEIEVSPSSHRAWFNLAQIVADRGEHPEAVVCLRAAITARPDVGVAYLYLGRSLLALDDANVLQEAAEAVRTGLGLDLPDQVRPMGQLLLEDIHRRIGDEAAARGERARANDRI